MSNGEKRAGRNILRGSTSAAIAVALCTASYAQSPPQVVAAADQPPPAQSGNLTTAQLLASDTDEPGDQLLPEPPGGSGIVRDADDIDFALGQRQIFSDLRTLQDRISDSQRPVANIVARRSSQSDDVDISHIEVSQDLFFEQGRGRIRPGFQAVRYTSDAGDRILQYAEGVTGNVRVSDGAALTGEVWLNQIKPQGSKSASLLTYDVFLTLFPSDIVRLDVDTNRRTFDNITSLKRGIASRYIGGSIDITPSNDLRLTVRGGGSFFNDTNRRQTVEAEAVWRAKAKPVIELGLRGTAFRFEKLLSNGYFNPKHYQSGEAMIRVQSALTDKLDLEVAGSGGIEHADPGGSKPIVKGVLELSYEVLKSWVIDGGVSYFSSRTSSSSGFARTSFTLGLHYRFK